MLCAHKLDSYRTDISIRVLCFGFNHNLYLHGFSFDFISIDVFDSVCSNFQDISKEYWTGAEVNHPKHELLIQLMPRYFPHYSMRVTKLKPMDEYGKNMCYNNNNFPASFLAFLHSPGWTTVFLFKISYIAVSILVTIVFFARSALFCSSIHFLTLLKHVRSCHGRWCVPVTILHDVKLWRTKTTTSPMGRSQYFISFWQAAWFFIFFFLIWCKHQRLDIPVVVAMQRHKGNICSIPLLRTYNKQTWFLHI